MMKSTLPRQLLDTSKVFLDSNGIYISKNLLSEDASTSKEIWEGIYDYSVDVLVEDLKKFNKDKLEDHLSYIDKYGNFNSDSVYLEIGCGPAYIGNYLATTKNCYFVGIDINYSMLLVLKEYFDSIGFEKYFLIHGEIIDIPLLDSSVDFIYGGGVIEHVSNTSKVLKESYRILKPLGVSFNTVPSLNLWWIFRFFRNIPSVPFARQLFEFIHIKLLRNFVLNKFYGYELSFTVPQLRQLHLSNGFAEVVVTPFAFHPSVSKLSNKLLRRIYFFLQGNVYTAIYLACARK